MNRRLTTNLLKAAVARRMVKLRHAVNFELGLLRRGSLRADVISMSSKGEFTIFEIKSCVADFVNDSKCARYLPYCNKFYFVFTESTWDKLRDKVEFPPQVGVLLQGSSGRLYVAKNSKRQPMDAKVHATLVLRMAYRNSEFSDLRAINKWKAKHCFQEK